MSKFQGFGELKTSLDLVQKLEHDLERIRDTPHDQYAAFDFFVTAEHILDWIYPTDGKTRSKLREEEHLLALISHIANGAKHFEARDKRHKSVTDVEKSRYVEVGYVEDGYFEDPLLIHLSEEQQKHFKASSVEVVTLAEQVLQYWRDNAPKA
ncbi:hypothetical protein SAMN05216315_10422 [Nitrosospira sp. Nsp18]|uniref:hypothetical protein n=1 Tax=Nitrosospira sp. Nsp18 TaxID=1855334 RepID=UPI00088A1E11|nr:hypothetical protein [Nitrosospira sp. Nsp18]SDA13152.1 hypothetical protein SAMN05216315_10422 [Nitrosospira sp. Nsp18]